MAIQRRLTDKEYHAIYDYISAAEYLKKADILLPLGMSVEMLHHNTTDGRPYAEPPLTDEDARSRPWVMVRDDDKDPFEGPYIFVCKTKERYKFAVALPGLKGLGNWRYARRATPEEIAAAGLEVAE
jgi:hypothetical protein